ncbi:MAG: tetratricopeptide repeat protein [Planctomycetaceae bacterium]|nr:tetratricopeptide repeat protein [Planctomycetaceae bacterium]
MTDDDALEAGDSSPDATVEVDVVCGEPISRSEAKQLGLILGPSDSGYFRVDTLGFADSSETPKKIHQALFLLERNRFDMALNMAQEAALENPSLTSAVVAVARCLIAKGEDARAYAQLSNIPDDKVDAESRYYAAEALANMGNRDDAISAVEQVLTMSPSSSLKVQAGELLGRLRAEARAATAAATAQKDVPETDVKSPAAGRAGRWLVFLVLLAALIALAVVAFSVFMPDQYRNIRGRLPAGWTFLPGDATPVQPPQTVPVSPSTPRTSIPRPFLKRPVAETIAAIPGLPEQIQQGSGRAG